MKTLNYQYKGAWLKGRSSRISATDIPVLMGTNTFTTRAELMDKKLGLADKEDLSQNSFVQFGNDWEDVVAQKVQAMVTPHQDVIYPGKWAVQVHPEHDWCSASCDFFLADAMDHGTIGPLETKTGMSSKWVTPPAYYVDQLHWQMFVTGMDHGYLAVLLLPKHEEERTKQVMENGKTRTVGASLRHEYLEACQLAATGKWEDREGGIPRILRAYEDCTVRVYSYGQDEERQSEMLRVAGEFHKELEERRKALKKEAKG